MPTDPRDKWTTFTFAQANPEGSGQGNVPALLRRVADSIEELGDVQVLDITYEVEMTAEGRWPSLSVYYVRE